MIFFLQKIALLLISIVNLLIGSHILIRNPKSNVHRSFFLFVVGVTMWITGIVVPLLISRFLSVPFILYGGVLMILGLVLLARSFPRFPIQKRFWLLLIPFVIIFCAIPFGLIIKTATISPRGFLIPVNGTAFSFFAILIGFYIVLSFTFFIKNYFKTSGIERLQMKYVVTGAFFFISLVFLFDVLLPNLGIFTFNLLGPAASVLFVGFTGYAIVKHRLLDLRIIASRTISFFILLIVVAFAYVLALFFFVNKITGIAHDVSVLVLVGIFIFTIAAMLTFQPLQNKIRKLTKQILFQDIYDSDELLSRLTLIMATTIDLNVITREVLKILTREVHIEKAAFLIVDNHAISDAIGMGYFDSRVSRELESLLHTKMPPGSLWLYDDLQDPSLKEVFKKLDIAVAIPLKVKDDEVAILILGQKSSGEIYYDKDIHLMKVFASEAGIAIQNAKTYLKVKQFNEQLEQKVEERTRELRQSHERELTKARDIARLKDEFVFIAAHELRAPVAVIKGFIQLTSKSLTDAPAEIQKYLQSISSASKQLNQLIDDVLEIARTESGMGKIETTPTDIGPIIEAGVTEFTPVAAERHVHISANIQKPLAPCLVHDQKLKEVLSNLISNAIKYNKENGSITLRVFKDKECVVVECADTGYGIPQKSTDKIFQRFFRAQTKETRDIQGTGLGLFITRMLVEKMGGVITFTSVEGQGTTFTVRLLIAKNNGV